MTQLEKLMEGRIFELEKSYSRQVALCLQPASHSDFASHPDFDKLFDLWTQNDKYRGLDLVRLWSIILNIQQILPLTQGALAEVGVYQGQCSAVLSHFARKFGRKLFLFDTFEGFDRAQMAEDEATDGKIAAFQDVELSKVKQIVGDYENNCWIVGKFPETLTSEIEKEAFSFVSIDCDIFEPIYASLRFFWPRLQPGGMIFVHDYSSGHWPGATRAVDAFSAENGVRGVALADMGGTIVFTRQPDSRT